MKKYLWILLFIPSLAFASIGEDLNNLLQNFFGEDKKKKVEETIEPPKVEIPEHPTPSDLTEIKEAIFWEEEGLNETQEQIQLTESELHDIQRRKNKLQTEITLIDENLGQIQNNAKDLAAQEHRWQTELEKVTYEKHELHALFRAQSREFEAFLQKNFLRNENFGAGGKGQLLKWIFSDKSVSQILEERRAQERFEVQKKAKLKKLNETKKTLDHQERHMASLYGQIASLHHQMTRQKKSMMDLVDQKAKTAAHLEFNEGKTKKEIQNLERQRKKSTHALQGLKAKMAKIQEKLLKNEGDVETSPSARLEEPIFQFPLKYPMRVMAKFHDEEYEKELGRPHEGVDLFAPQGTAIHAPADGVVMKTVFNGFGYAYLVLEHGNGFHTVYGHVSDILVNEGQKVVQGDVIAKTGGAEGSEGAGYFTAGEHLHFEVLKDGKFLDPMKFLK